jgi:hypothetical protein
MRSPLSDPFRTAREVASSIIPSQFLILNYKTISNAILKADCEKSGSIEGDRARRRVVKRLDIIV